VQLVELGGGVYSGVVAGGDGRHSPYMQRLTVNVKTFTLADTAWLTKCLWRNCLLACCLSGRFESCCFRMKMVRDLRILAPDCTHIVDQLLDGGDHNMGRVLSLENPHFVSSFARGSVAEV
jgi:hypothetical protein